MKNYTDQNQSSFKSPQYFHCLTTIFLVCMKSNLKALFLKIQTKKSPVKNSIFLLLQSRIVFDALLIREDTYYVFKN